MRQLSGCSYSRRLYWTLAAFSAAECDVSRLRIVKNRAVRDPCVMNWREKAGCTASRTMQWSTYFTCFSDCSRNCYYSFSAMPGHLFRDFCREVELFRDLSPKLSHSQHQAATNQPVIDGIKEPRKRNISSYILGVRLSYGIMGLLWYPDGNTNWWTDVPKLPVWRTLHQCKQPYFIIVLTQCAKSCR